MAESSSKIIKKMDKGFDRDTWPMETPIETPGSSYLVHGDVRRPHEWANLIYPQMYYSPNAWRYCKTFDARRNAESILIWDSQVSPTFVKTYREKAKTNVVFECANCGTLQSTSSELSGTSAWSDDWVSWFSASKNLAIEKEMNLEKDGEVANVKIIVVTICLLVAAIAGSFAFLLASLAGTVRIVSIFTPLILFTASIGLLGTLLYGMLVSAKRIS